MRDGKRNGLEAWWYVGGTGLDESPNIKKSEELKNGKLMSAVVWKPDGEKCPVTNVKDRNGIMVSYSEDWRMRETDRWTYKDGERVED